MHDFGSSAVVYAVCYCVGRDSQASSRLVTVRHVCCGCSSRTPSALNAGLGEVNLDSVHCVLGGWSRGEPRADWPRRHWPLTVRRGIAAVGRLLGRYERLACMASIDATHAVERVLRCAAGAVLEQ